MVIQSGLPASVAATHNAPNSYQSLSSKIPELTTGGEGKDANIFLSGAGKQALAKENSKTPGLEVFRLPSWYVDYLPPGGDLSMSAPAVREAKKYQHIDEAARSDGIVTSGEKKVIDAYWKNMTSNQAIRDQARFQQQYENEIEEYGRYARDAFLNAKAGAGIDTHEDYVNKMLSDVDSSESIHNTFRDELFSNPRAVELMEVIGIAERSR